MSTDNNFLGQNIIYSCFSNGAGLSISREENTICISEERKNDEKRKEIHLMPEAFDFFLCELKQNVNLLNVNLDNHCDFQQTVGDIRFLQRNKKLYIAEKGKLKEPSPNEIPVSKDVFVTFKRDVVSGNIYS